MKTITVSVTQEDIDAGERSQPNKCAMALALQRTFDDPLASCGFVTAQAGGKVFLQLSDRFSDFVMAFDHGKPVQPSRFRLRVPA